MLDRILQYTNDDNWDGKVFVDIGSGTGRLVFAAAALHSHWKKCRGIELLPGLNKAAEDTLDQCCLAKHKEPPVPEKKLPKSNELWIPSIQSIGGDNAFSGGKPLIQSLSDDDWLSNLQNQFDEDEEDEFDEGHAEDKKQSAFTYADTENLESDIGIDSTEACGDESFDDEGDHQVNTETDKSSEEPRSGLFCPQDENASKDEGETIGLAPIEFVQGSFDDPFMYFSDADLVFSFASAFPKDVMKKLSRAIGTKCKPGTVVVTIDHNLDHVGVIEPSVSQDYGFDLPTGPYKLDLLEQLDGWCWLTGGISTAYIYRVETSLWEQQEHIQGPTLRDRAFQAVKLAEAEKLANAQQFLRGVYNNMVFYGFPESWRPKLESIPYEKYLVEFQYY